MNYLKLETSKLLQEKGCKSSSGVVWAKNHILQPIEFVNMRLPYTPAYDFNDICTKENAIKIWTSVLVEEKADWKTLKFVPSAFGQPHYKLAIHKLLDMKLNGDDWEEELLKHLEGK